MSIHVEGGAETDEAGTPLENKLRSALEAARAHIVTLGGDSSGLLTEAEAHECSVDMIQWQMLRVIDDALASY